MQRSETISEVSKAMVKFSSEVGKINKDAKNPFLKNNYASLDNILDAVKPILAQNGLFLVQDASSDGQNVKVITTIFHESGEYISSDEYTLRPVKNDPQSMGSVTTYAKRYSITSFLGLSTGDDDDGNAASNTEGNQRKQGNHRSQGNQGQQTNQNQNNARITQNQLKALNDLVQKGAQLFNSEPEKILQSLRKKEEVGNFADISSMTSHQASAAIGIMKTMLPSN